MTTYYVRSSMGNDTNDGLTPASAWLTIDKAANTVVAGDLVYIGAGVYRELVTMDTSGTSGNQISYIADVTGAQTGDAGMVVISAFTHDMDYTAQRIGCWNQNGKEFITIQGFNMVGNLCIYDSQLAGNRSYEGVIIQICVLNGRTTGIDLDFNTGATPAGATGLTIRRCVMTTLLLRHDTNASAHINLKLLIENVIVHTYMTTNTIGIWLFSGLTANAFSVGGMTIANCTIYGGANNISIVAFKNTTNVSKVYNPIGYGTTTVVQGASGTTAAVEVYNIVAQVMTGVPYTGVTSGNSFNIGRQTNYLKGGIDDYPLYYYLGWSPFLPGAPIHLSGLTPPVSAAGHAELYQPTTDLYGNSRSMNRPIYSAYYHFDASDDAVSDPDARWTTEANIFDADPTTSGGSATAGSAVSNYVFAGGTNAPATGGTITAVYARVRAHGSTNLGVEIYTDTLAESLGSLTFTLQSSATEHLPWQALATPTGGWTWGVLQALEVKAWPTSSASITLYVIQLAVVTSTGHNDAGAVEARTRPAQETTTFHDGANAANFQGAGYYDTFRPVNATGTTITVWARKDSNYTGTAAKLEVVNIPGVADQSDSLTVAADTWEQLTVTFTPTSAGMVRIRLWSYDTSATGKCFFDDLVVT